MKPPSLASELAESGAGWMLLSRASREGSPQHEIYSKAVDQLSAASDLESSGTEGCGASLSVLSTGGARARRRSDKPQAGAGIQLSTRLAEGRDTQGAGGRGRETSLSPPSLAWR